MKLLGISLAVSSIALAIFGLTSLALSRAALNGKIQRNGSFGIRTEATTKSDAAWTAGHEAAAPSLRAFGFLDVAISLALVAVGLALPDLNSTLALTIRVIAYATAFGGFIFATVKANAAAKEVPWEQ